MYRLRETIEFHMSTATIGFMSTDTEDSDPWWSDTRESEDSEPWWSDTRESEDSEPWWSDDSESSEPCSSDTTGSDTDSSDTAIEEQRSDLNPPVVENVNIWHDSVCYINLD